MKKLITYLMLILIVGLSMVTSSRATGCITPNTFWTPYQEIVKLKSNYNDNYFDNTLFGDFKRADPVLGNIFIMKYMKMFGMVYKEPEELMPSMLQDIINNSPKIFNIADPTAPYTIRIQFPACWTEARDLFGGPIGGMGYVGGWKACQNSGCCSVVLGLQKVDGKIVIRTKVVISATDCSGGIASENTPCHYVCNFINDLPVVPSGPIDPPPGPCFDNCGERIPSPDFLPSGGIPFDLPEDNIHIKIAPKLEISKCPDGTINISLEGLNSVGQPDFSLLPVDKQKVLMKFVMEYILKYFTGNNLTQKVKFSVPTFNKSNTGFTPILPLNCCEVLFDLYKTGGETYIKSMSLGCSFNTDIPNEGPGDNQIPVDKPLLPDFGSSSECDLECYWKIGGNHEIDDAHNFIGPTNGEDFIIKTGNGPLNTERMRVKGNGEIEIKTPGQDGLQSALKIINSATSPNNPLTFNIQDNGAIQVKGPIRNILPGNSVLFDKIYIGAEDNPPSSEKFTVVGSAYITETAKIGGNLKVHGTVYTTEVLCKDPLTWWPDYVFDANYKLTPLSELSDFITKYKHLPDVPSQAAVATDGVKLVEMQGILLKKIEEITLHLIRLEKENENLKKKVKKLKSSN